MSLPVKKMEKGQKILEATISTPLDLRVLVKWVVNKMLDEDRKLAGEKNG